MRWLGLLIACFMMSGCTRAYYRRWADEDTYEAIEERNNDARWEVPKIRIDPSPAARFADASSPDRPPLPPDNPDAHQYMHRANGMHGSLFWHHDGDAPWIEDPQWLDCLTLENGVLKLTPDRSVELGLLHSRDYQTQLEQMYLIALGLTFNRFDFALHWFGTNDTRFNTAGQGPGEPINNNLTSNPALGFNKAFAAGGNLLVEWVNNFMFQFQPGSQFSVGSNIIINFVQPLLQNAGRKVRMEALTMGERNLLYTLRSFARYRKQFTFNLTTNGYVQLLLQQQAIRNQRATLAALQQNLRLHQALFASGSVSEVKVEQVFLSAKLAEAGLVQAESVLETAKDAFLFRLGLPPTIPIALDDSMLAPFELNDPALTSLQEEIDKKLATYRELDVPPTLDRIKDAYGDLKKSHARMSGFIDEIRKEMDSWKLLIEHPDEQTAKENIERQRIAFTARSKDLAEVKLELEKIGRAIDNAAVGTTSATRPQSWEMLKSRTHAVSVIASELFVIQTQVRVYLIKLHKVDWEEKPAIRYALDNRLDLMNQQGMVVDAWRQIAVTANALETELDVVFNGSISNLPGSMNPVDFRAAASSYSVGFHLDTPLNRYLQRNNYRTSLVSYQQARRAYMALEDSIEQAVRLDLRQLRTERLNFEIARQSLISAARQVESAREELLLQGKDADPTSTQNIINALNAVLAAKNSLIGSWVNYETDRMQLLLDLEALQLDERGIYQDEHDHRTDGPLVDRNVPGK